MPSYGLEGVLNDATAKRIIEIIVPRFRENDFYGGIAAGVDSIISVIDGEAPGLRQLLPIALVGAFVLGGILRAVLGRTAGAAVTGGASGRW